MRVDIPLDEINVLAEKGETTPEITIAILNQLAFKYLPDTAESIKPFIKEYGWNDFFGRFGALGFRYLIDGKLQQTYVTTTRTRTDAIPPPASDASDEEWEAWLGVPITKSFDPSDKGVITMSIVAFEPLLKEKGDAHQVLQLNPEAALQQAMFNNDYAPNSPEFEFEHTNDFGLTQIWVAQRSENLWDGDVRYFCAVKGQWDNIFWSGGAAGDLQPVPDESEFAEDDDDTDEFDVLVDDEL